MHKTYFVRLTLLLAVTTLATHQFNPRNHVGIGAALNNYGTYLTQTGAGSAKTGVGFKINQQQKALKYYAEALRHLRKTNRKTSCTIAGKTAGWPGPRSSG